MPKLKAELRTPTERPPDPDVIDGEVIETSLVPYSPNLPATAAPQLAEEMSLAQVFAKSGLFADAKAASQAVVKILAGRDLGIPPTVAMTGIYMVQGRLTLSANLMAALVRRSPVYDYLVTSITNQECTIEFTRHGKPCGTSTFSLADAKTAGVAGGHNWTKYPRNMLFARALSNGLKWFCPDLTLGPVYTPEELSETGTDLATASVGAAEWLPTETE